MSCIYSDHNIEMLHIVPGYFCNLECSHCGSNSGPKEKVKFSQKEIEDIQTSINKYRPPCILFTGGEPTFFIDSINEILSVLPTNEIPLIKITTNGWFSKSNEKIEEILTKIVKINCLQLSYDVFHGSNLTYNDIIRLKDYCENKKIAFNISVCISSPLDFNNAAEILKNVKTIISYQKVEPSGRAKKSQTNFKYFKFQDEVLDKQCSNLNQISYIPGKGFTTCCSSLIYNNEISDTCHADLIDHLNSSFRSLIKKHTFKELLELKSIPFESLSPQLSSPCALCEYIQTYKKD
ncbi:MAG: radical SAM protein [Oligoflexia bacterium]|nr:radical SAM protein [Oligoflexia bacterium]